MNFLFRRFRAAFIFKSVWTTFVLLFVSVMVPTLCVIWLVGRASKNEQLALQQVLTNSRLREATLLRNQVLLITNEWKDSIENLFDENEVHSVLSQLLSRNLGEALVVTGGRSAVITGGEVAPFDEPLIEIRYLAQSLGEEAAIEQIRSLTKDSGINDIRMDDGSLLRPFLFLLGIEYGLEAGVDVSDFIDHLIRLLTQTGDGKMPAAQRRFLFQELLENGIGTEQLIPFSRAESLAAIWRRNREKGVIDEPEGGFRVNDNLVYLNFPEMGVIWLMRFETFERQLLNGLSGVAQDDIVSVELLKPGMVVEEDPTTFDILDMGYPMEGWRLKIGNSELSEIGSGANQHIVIYVWVGSLTILISVVLIFMSMGMVRRHMAMAQLKNDLVATVSHELKTPVASIRLLVETLLDDPEANKEKIRDYLELIRNENHRLGHLVQKFLTFSRMEQSQRYFDIEPVAANEVLSEAEQVFRERFPGNDYELKVDCAPYLSPVSADREALLSAIGNLLENAYKYSDQDKKIYLRCSETPELTIFEVEDNGFGIAKNERTRIFQKFYQPERRLNKHKGGVGLGLSIVSLVARKHKGKVEVESEPGKGSRFRIVIPHA